MLIFLCSGIYNLTTSILSGDCADGYVSGKIHYCIEDFIMSTTIANKRNHHSSMVL